ncbi:hypothetical protein EVAR_92030_1 [Eumeta japonica]|uniref:Uncharacterized protein n=1 Tax=Eumeta variegata TaxID=151549 RepID=A0A4C2A501_EUMVA|nr:hypothetical protein EVAR_92030_1 [Eumeta japonica]
MEVDIAAPRRSPGGANTPTNYKTPDPRPTQTHLQMVSRAVRTPIFKEGSGGKSSPLPESNWNNSSPTSRVPLSCLIKVKR